MTRHDLSGERVAVTGAGGFIGLALCHRLVADGADVVGLDRNASAAARVSASGAAFALGDTTRPATLDAAFAGCSGVIHTAALVHAAPKTTVINTHSPNGGNCDTISGRDAISLRNPATPYVNGFNRIIQLNQPLSEPGKNAPESSHMGSSTRFMMPWKP